MTRLFADTSYYLALLSRNDEVHSQALKLTPDLTAPMVTTGFVLTELVDAMSRAPWRPLAVEFVRGLCNDGRVDVVPASQQLFDAGLNLFAQRQDKDWSLTDCISFVVMRERGIADALTADRHFEQAGFNVLIK